jgi:predicted HD superfamily hydrolase involved in NAD metabolism
VKFNPEPFVDRLQEFVGPKRLAHSQNVCEAARALARHHAPELEEKAAIAGICHDNAKKLSDAELISSAARFDIAPSRVELVMPSLLHGKVGAALLPERFGVDDPEVAQAVADHVTGRPGMGLLSRIIFVADQSAADRTFEGVERLRVMMLEDLDKAVLMVSRGKILSVAHRGWLIEEATMNLYNEMVMAGVRIEL